MGSQCATDRYAMQHTDIKMKNCEKYGFRGKNQLQL